MNSIDYACSLNNQGVELLVSGESSRAMKVFQSALCLLQAIHEAFEPLHALKLMYRRAMMTRHCHFAKALRQCQDFKACTVMFMIMAS
jgi:hypothetical protein